MKLLTLVVLILCLIANCTPAEDNKGPDGIRMKRGILSNLFGSGDDESTTQRMGTMIQKVNNKKQSVSEEPNKDKSLNEEKAVSGGAFA